MPQPKVTLFALLAGVLMATFQLLRPWGDISEDPQSMAEAFADTRWVIAHLAGAASFVMLAALARVAAVASSAKTGTGRPTRVAGIAQVAMATGAALVLPYYGAETFALHEARARFLGRGFSRHRRSQHRYPYESGGDRAVRGGSAPHRRRRGLSLARPRARRHGVVERVAARSAGRIRPAAVRVAARRTRGVWGGVPHRGDRLRCVTPGEASRGCKGCRMNAATP